MKVHKSGHWLKAEAREYSPFWKMRYGELVIEEEEEEIVPETPIQNTQLITSSMKGPECLVGEL